MKYFYIIDINGTIWGSFDSVTNAENFGKTLEGGYKFITNQTNWWGFNSRNTREGVLVKRSILTLEELQNEKNWKTNGVSNS